MSPTVHVMFGNTKERRTISVVGGCEAPYRGCEVLSTSALKSAVSMVVTDNSQHVSVCSDGGCLWMSLSVFQLSMLANCVQIVAGIVELWLELWRAWGKKLGEGLFKPVGRVCKALVVVHGLVLNFGFRNLGLNFGLNVGLNVSFSHRIGVGDGEGVIVHLEKNSENRGCREIK